MKITMVKKDNGLFPANIEDAEALDNVEPGRPLSCEIKQKRNPRFHAKLMKLFRAVYENLPEGFCIVVNGHTVPVRSMENLIWLVKMDIGHYSQKIDIAGRIHYEAKSFSFAKMDNTEFTGFYDKCVNSLFRNFIQDEDFYNELNISI